jgi:hypothetical protein
MNKIKTRTKKKYNESLPFQRAWKELLLALNDNRIDLIDMREYWFEDEIKGQENI